MPHGTKHHTAGTTADEAAPSSEITALQSAVDKCRTAETDALARIHDLAEQTGGAKDDPAKVFKLAETTHGVWAALSSLKKTEAEIAKQLEDAAAALKAAGK